MIVDFTVLCAWMIIGYYALGLYEKVRGNRIEPPDAIGDMLLALVFWPVLIILSEIEQR